MAAFQDGFYGIDKGSSSMILRSSLLLLPLLLAGCSLWHNTLDLFTMKNELQVTSQGVARVDAMTPMTETALKKALDNRYRLRFGMSVQQGIIEAFYQVIRDDKVILVIRGPKQGKVEQIDVFSDAVKTAWGGKVGMPFEDFYSQAYGHCRKVGSGVECQAKESAHVSYLFTGKWLGSSSLIPADDILRHWKVSGIIWRAKSL